MRVKNSADTNKIFLGNQEKENVDKSYVKNMQHPNEKVHTEIYESLYDALVESTNKLIEDKVPSTGSMESKVQEKETGNENTDPHSLAINVAPEEGGTDSITFYNMNLPVDKANSIEKYPGKKRRFEDDNDDYSSGPNEKFISPPDVTYASYMIMKKKCIEFEERLKVIQAKSDIPEANRDLTNINDFQNDSTEVNRRDDVLITNIIETLCMSGQDLYTCNGKKATTTARNIMRFKYPKVSTNFKFSSIDKSIPDAILKYTKISNPFDKSSNAQIRRAMSLLVSSMTHKARKIAGGFSKQHHQN